MANTIIMQDERSFFGKNNEKSRRKNPATLKRKDDGKICGCIALFAVGDDFSIPPERYVEVSLCASGFSIWINLIPCAVPTGYAISFAEEFDIQIMKSDSRLDDQQRFWQEQMFQSTRPGKSVCVDALYRSRDSDTLELIATDKGFRADLLKAFSQDDFFKNVSSEFRVFQWTDEWGFVFFWMFPTKGVGFCGASIDK